jgi:hypothetical protein
MCSAPKVYPWTPESPVNLWELAGRFQGDLVGRPQQLLSRGERCVLRQGVDYWPDAVVPVDIQKAGFGEYQSRCGGARRACKVT